MGLNRISFTSTSSGWQGATHLFAEPGALDRGATGTTMKAALRGVRRNGPSRLILAAPVAPRSSIDELAAECDDIVCLEAPEPFFAVGLHSVDFAQTTDDEVVELLAKARQRRAEPSNQGSVVSPSTSSRSTRSG